MRNVRLALSLIGLANVAMAAIAGEASAAQDFTGRIWMHAHEPWQSPPPELELDQTYAQVTLLRLNSDHTLSLIHCTVNKGKKWIAISVGDGLAIYKGEWAGPFNEILVRYENTYRSGTIHVVGPDGTKRPFKDPPQTGRASLEGESLIFDGKKYSLVEGLDDDFDEFANAGERKSLN